MATHQFSLKRFISESITVDFLSQPPHSKSPPCPNSFCWNGLDYHIIRCLHEWQDFSRHGRMARNMQPQHAELASKKGSWGVGRFYFDVQTDENQHFRLYYDRVPKDALDRHGHWILLAELEYTED